jgi:hypothetical protein
MPNKERSNDGGQRKEIYLTWHRHTMGRGKTTFQLIFPVWVFALGLNGEGRIGGRGGGYIIIKQSSHRYVLVITGDCPKWSLIVLGLILWRLVIIRVTAAWQG